MNALRRARGFTLLEVLLAIGMIVLLSASMFAFYEFSLNTRQRTQESVQQAQLARAILNRMSEDLSGLSSLTAMVRMRQASRGFAVVGATTGTTPEGGLVGSADSLAFQSSRFIPISRFVEAKSTSEQQAQAARPPLYDVQEIRWYWSFDAATGASQGLYRTYRPASLSAANVVVVAPAEPERAAPPTGGEPAASQPAEPEPVPSDLDEGDTGGPPAAEQDPLLIAECVSPEVQWMYLRYFDGTTWTEQFQGGPSGISPRAVEITIGFSPLLTQQDIDAGKTAADRFAELFGADAQLPLPRDSYQLIVHMPSGEIAGGGGIRMQRR